MSFSSVGWYEFGTERQYPTYKWMELARSADYLCRKILQIEPGENVVMYADTATDPRVVPATSAAAHTIGAKVTTLWYETRGDIDLPPPEPVEAAVLAADMVIEFAVAYLVHSAMWAKARKKGIDLKCLTGMNADMMVRTINPDFDEKMNEFGAVYREVVMRGKKTGRVTSKAGTDFTFKFYTPKVLEELARARPPMKRGGMLGGQGNLNANPATINGKIVVDGAFWPPSELGLLKEPIEMTCKDGRITIVSDHHEGRIAKNWFAHFRDERVYNVLHVSTGFNPGVKRLTGDIVEDERLFGCVEFGVGRANPELPCHTDCILTNPSIRIDDEHIEENGIFVEPTLKGLAKELGMQLWVE